jgi:hypothetical protein
MHEKPIEDWGTTRTFTWSCEVVHTFLVAPSVQHSFIADLQRSTSLLPDTWRTKAVGLLALVKIEFFLRLEDACAVRRDQRSDLCMTLRASVLVQAIGDSDPTGSANGTQFGWNQFRPFKQLLKNCTRASSSEILPERLYPAAFCSFRSPLFFPNRRNFSKSSLGEFRCFFSL